MEKIREIQTPTMKASSLAKLKESRAHFTELNQSLAHSERKMVPVLVRLKDHVLYLNHNLNAESLASMKTEHNRIQSDIESLLKEMNASIWEADEFIRTIR